MWPQLPSLSYPSEEPGKNDFIQQGLNMEVFIIRG